jgi:heat shock protein HslJ
MKKTIILAALMATLTVIVPAQAERPGTRQWKLVQVEGIRVTNASRAYIELNADQTKFTGHTGCNRINGAIDLRGRRIDFSNVAMTKMACVEQRASRVEASFVRALENADRFRQTGNSLDLIDRNRVVARLTAMTKQMPDSGKRRVDLEDRKWILEAIKGVAVSKAGQTAFLVFDKNKASAGGNSSCNVFGGDYTATDRTLKITDVISTMRACIEDDRMAIERDFLDGIRQANRFEILGNKLMLKRDERLLLTFAGERK